jgi:hypothetical protein
MRRLRVRLVAELEQLFLDADVPRSPVGRGEHGDRFEQLALLDEGSGRLER